MIEENKFKSFEIEVLTPKLAEFQVEVAEVGTKRMIIITDTVCLLRENVYRQEAYGPAVVTKEIIDEVVPILIDKLKKRRLL